MVVDALDEFVAKHPPERYSGLMPAEVAVVFRVEAGTTVSTTGSADLEVLEIVSVAGESASSSSEVAANTITIKFRSVAFARKDEVVGYMSPEELKQLYERLRKFWIVAR